MRMPVFKIISYKQIVLPKGHMAWFFQNWVSQCVQKIIPKFDFWAVEKSWTIWKNLVHTIRKE